MRFRVTANDGYPPDASFDPSAFEFITRARANGDQVGATASVQLDLFVRECKRLGFWNKMVYVPCRLGYGALNTLGGAPQRTNAKFVRVGTTSVTGVGVKFIPSNYYANHIETPFNWSTADEPIFAGVLGYAENGADTVPDNSALKYTGSNYLLGTYGSGVGVAGYYTPGFTGLQFFTTNPDFTTLKKPNFMGAQFDGSHTLKCILGTNYAELTHATATTGRPVGKLWFMQAASYLSTHVIQGCVLFYGDVSNMPMQTFYNLQASTLLDDIYGKTVYAHLGGQSNAGYATLTELQMNLWRTPSSVLFQTSWKSYAGAAISYWIGADPLLPVRQAAYETEKNIWLDRKPLVQSDKWDAPFIWMQGETDSEQETQAQDYLNQLKNFATFLRQDLRPDLLMAIGLIDYTVAARTRPNYGDFAVSECGGSAATANGVWNITPYSGLANANISYDWTRASVWRVSKDGGPNSNQWRIHANGVTYYLGAGSEAHPRMVTAWTVLNGATGAPVINATRTGNIEIVRKAQRDFVAQDSRAILFDSRGCERGTESVDLGPDDVHMTLLGVKTFAARFAAAYAATR